MLSDIVDSRYVQQLFVYEVAELANTETLFLEETQGLGLTGILA